MVDVRNGAAFNFARLRAILGETYTSEGVDIWMTGRHRSWGGLTVDEMLTAGREVEVMTAAERTKGMIAT